MPYFYIYQSVTVNDMTFVLAVKLKMRYMKKRHAYCIQ